MLKANEDLRTRARKAGVSFWKIAEILGLSEASMTRKLRRELPEDEKRKILAIIQEISEKEENET